VRHRHALALDHVHAERGRVEQNVRQVVVEQVDLVDVEDAAVRLGQQPRLQCPLARFERPGDVDAPGDAILGRVQRQVDDPPPPARHRQLLARGHAVPARPARVVGRTGEHAVCDGGDLRQQLGQAADRGRLAGAARPLDQDTADRRVDRVEQERPNEALLPDDRREREVAELYVITSRFPNVGSAWVIGGNCQVPISGTAVSRLTLTSTT
jgi:hypothetical protein